VVRVQTSTDVSTAAHAINQVVSHRGGHMELRSGKRFALLVAALTATACGGGSRAGGSDTTAMSSTTTGDTAAMTSGTTAAPTPAADTATTTPASTPAPSAPAAAAPAEDHPSTAAKPAPKASASAAGAAQDTGKTAAKPTKPSGGAPTAQQIALGDSIFHGTAAGGTCSACHGQDAKGTAVAPNLTDNAWLNGDGSYQFIVTTVTNGVPKPKEHPAPMPPKGGAALSDEQVKAVAGYVYSLSHKS
jgi:mono/diheme cytochrome c family protein